MHASRSFFFPSRGSPCLVTLTLLSLHFLFSFSLGAVSKASLVTATFIPEEYSTRGFSVLDSGGEPDRRGCFHPLRRLWRGRRGILFGVEAARASAAIQSWDAHEPSMPLAADKNPGNQKVPSDRLPLTSPRIAVLAGRRFTRKAWNSGAVTEKEGGEVLEGEVWEAVRVRPFVRSCVRVCVCVETAVYAHFYLRLSSRSAGARSLVDAP